MPRTIAILYFSGTGNTKAITILIAAEFKKENRVEVIKAEDILRHRVKFDPGHYDLVGIGYPIYGFNVPLNIYELVDSLEAISGKEFFIYSTCAGPFYLNDIASIDLKNRLRKKGGEVVYEKQFYMPANIGIRYPDQLSKQLSNAAVPHAHQMASDIIRGIRKTRNDGLLPLLFHQSYVIWEKPGWFTVALDFRVRQSCDLCKVCVRSCPRDNIFVKNERIRFRFHCMACYRCVYNCPMGAITGRFYKIAILKDGYDIKKIINDDRIKGDYVTSRTRGYYRIFYNYIYKND